MQYQGTLIVVSDIEKSKHFYEHVMEQTIIMDLGVHVSFERGLALQSNYAELVGADLPAASYANSFQLYFEVENLDEWQDKIGKTDGIEFIHLAKEYPWGQRVMRFYDYDKHIIEVAESMEFVAKRFLAQGLSIEEAAERTMFPLEYIKNLL